VTDALGRKLPVRDADLTPFARPWWKPGRVAVIMIDGAITDGAGPTSPLPQDGISWSDAVIGALADVRGDSSIKAVVLRVNSPGGSAYASDRMAREVARLRKAGKPVVVSMGDVAASGGYYVAAPGEVVYADPSTVTGSIGIFSYKIDVKELMDKVGLGQETSKRGERADQNSLYRPWTDGEREAARERITGMYGLFLDTVARGRSSRGITRERANELGRGRVYTGAEALGLGLVDRMGGLDVAIDDAAARAGVSLGRGGLPELVVLPRKPASGLRALIGIEAGAAGSANVAVEAVARLARPAVRLLLPLLVEGGSGVQARLPYDIDIR
jgi:protease-4